MRTLTLDEKITIKGQLCKKPFFRGLDIINGTTKEYMQWFYWCFGKPLQYAFNKKQFHKSGMTHYRRGKNK